MSELENQTKQIGSTTLKTIQSLKSRQPTGVKQNESQQVSEKNQLVLNNSESEANQSKNQVTSQQSTAKSRIRPRSGLKKELMNQEMANSQYLRNSSKNANNIITNVGVQSSLMFENQINKGAYNYEIGNKNPSKLTQRFQYQKATSQINNEIVTTDNEEYMGSKYIQTKKTSSGRPLRNLISESLAVKDKTTPLATQKPLPESTPKTYQLKEYINIDVNFAIEYVLGKAKQITERLETLNMSEAFFQENVIKSKHFQLTFQNFLNKLISSGKLNQDFKNMNKHMFDKMENFFLKRIDKVLEFSKISSQQAQKSREIKRMFETRMQILQQKLKESILI